MQTHVVEAEIRGRRMQRAKRAVAEQLLQPRGLEDAVRAAERQRRASDGAYRLADHVFRPVGVTPDSPDKSFSYWTGASVFKARTRNPRAYLCNTEFGEGQLDPAHNDHGNTKNQTDFDLYYSVDLAVPNLARPHVVAQANGRVIDFRDDTPDAPGSASLNPVDNLVNMGLANFGNYLTVWYDDGTGSTNGIYATYMHLAQNSVKSSGIISNPPSTVILGQTIAMVGHTGAEFTSVPNGSAVHLHITYGKQLKTISSSAYPGNQITNGANCVEINANGYPVYFTSSPDGILRDSTISAGQPGTILFSDNQGASTGAPPAAVAVSPQKVGVQPQQPSTMADWFFASTQSQNPVTWWYLWDDNSDLSSGYFSIAQGYYFNQQNQPVFFFRQSTNETNLRRGNAGRSRGVSFFRRYPSWSNERSVCYSVEWRLVGLAALYRDYRAVDSIDILAVPPQRGQPSPLYRSGTSRC